MILKYKAIYSIILSLCVNVAQAYDADDFYNVPRQNNDPYSQGYGAQSEKNLERAQFNQHQQIERQQFEQREAAERQGYGNQWNQQQYVQQYPTQYQQQYPYPQQQNGLNNSVNTLINQLFKPY